jgi:hypothetical protein
MDEDMVFDNINSLLEGSRQPFGICDMDDLERFVNNSGSRKIGAYHQIRQLYTDMMKDNGMVD